MGSIRGDQHNTWHFSKIIQIQNFRVSIPKTEIQTLHFKVLNVETIVFINENCLNLKVSTWNFASL